MTAAPCAESASPPPRPGVPLRADVEQSVRNAVKLGTSLLATWTVALAIRIALPRVLGPSSFGVFQFADSFTATAFIITHLGVETYVRKEVATRPDHATEFFGGMLVVRFTLSAIVMAGAIAALIAAGKPAQVWHLVVFLGTAQVLLNLNNVFAALLHAKGEVGGLSVLNVASKLTWGLGVGVALATGAGVFGVAVALLLSETLRTVALSVLTRRHLGLRLAIDRRATMAMLGSSLPYYLSALAQTVYGKIDISVLSFMTNDREVGWYGAAANVAGVSLLMSPLIGWVLLPLSARAVARSEADLTALTRRAMELILMSAIPISLMIFLGAEPLVTAVFGQVYAPAARSMRVLAPVFVLTYAAIVSGSVLIRLGHGWWVTWVSIGGGIAAPLMDLVLIPRTAQLGPGGAGIGAGIALIVTEFGTTTAMTALLGGRAFDRRSTVALAKALVACVVVIAADRVMAPLGNARLVADALLYAAIVVGWRAVDVRGTVAFVRSAMRAGASVAQEGRAEANA